MKRFLLLSLLLAMSLSAASAQGLRRPDALRPGDKVAILSPASTPDSTLVKAIEKVFDAWGLQTVRGEHVLANSHVMYAGTPQERLSDLREALYDPSIKAIICSRGGHGSYHELQLMDLAAVRDNPKWLIGYSDITAMHSAWQSAGVMSIHGPMGGNLKDRGASSPDNLALKKILMGEHTVYDLPGSPLNFPGTVSGRLVGGNLTLIGTVGGSCLDWMQNFPVDEPVILFIEDVEESIPRVNRMLNHLKLIGMLSRVQGILVGQFTDYDAIEWPSMEHMIAEFLKDYDIPVGFGFPAGHGMPNYPLVLGEMATMTVTKDSLKLEF